MVKKTKIPAQAHVAQTINTLPFGYIFNDTKRDVISENRICKIREKTNMKERTTPTYL